MKKKISTNRGVFSIIMLIITGLYIGFIWWHSTLSAMDSTVESLNVMYFLDDFFRMLGFNAELTNHIVRKSAHFCEFALLGCLSMWSAFLNKRRIIKNLTSVGFVCLVTAVVDECIQIYSPGRSAEVPDVVLDFCGAAAGVIFWFVIYGIVKLFKR